MFRIWCVGNRLYRTSPVPVSDELFGQRSKLVRLWKLVVTRVVSSPRWWWKRTPTVSEIHTRPTHEMLSFGCFAETCLYVFCFGVVGYTTPPPWPEFPVHKWHNSLPWPGSNSTPLSGSIVVWSEAKSVQSTNPVLERVSQLWVWPSWKVPSTLAQAWRAKTTSETCPALKHTLWWELFGSQNRFMDSKCHIPNIHCKILYEYPCKTWCECDRREKSLPQALKTKNDLRKVSSVENTL